MFYTQLNKFGCKGMPTNVVELRCMAGRFNFEDDIVSFQVILSTVEGVQISDSGVLAVGGTYSDAYQTINSDGTFEFSYDDILSDFSINDGDFFKMYTERTDDTPKTGLAAPTPETTVTYVHMQDNSVAPTVPTVPTLSLSMVADDETLLENTAGFFTITAGNLGPDAQTNVVVTMTLDSALSLDGATGLGVDVSGAPTITWNLGSVAAGAEETLVVNYTANDTSGLSFVNVNQPVTITSTEGNNSPLTVTAPLSITGNVNSPVDLDLVFGKSASPPNPTEGDTVTWTIIVSNSSGFDANNIVVTDFVPSSLPYVASSITGLGADDTDPTELVWNIGTLNNGTNLTLTFDTIANIGSGGNTVTNEATISGDNINNDLVEEGVSIAALPTVALLANKFASNNSPMEGDTVSWSIAVVNTTLDDAVNLVVVDSIDSDMTYVASSITGTGADDSNTSQMQWDIPLLAAGDNVTLGFQTTINAGTAGNSIGNTANISGANVTSQNASTGITVASPPQPAAISINKTASVPNVDIGNAVQYFLEVQNNSPGVEAALNMIVTDVIPNGMTYVPASGSGTGFDDSNAPTLEWDFGTFSSGSAEFLSYLVQADGLPGAPYDLDLLGDTASGTVEISGAWIYTPSQDVTVDSISQLQTIVLFTPNVTRRLLIKTGGINGTIVGTSDDLSYVANGGVRTYTFSTPVDLTSGTSYHVVFADTSNSTVNTLSGDGVSRTTGVSDVNNEVNENGAGTPDKVIVRVEGTGANTGGNVTNTAVVTGNNIANLPVQDSLTVAINNPPQFANIETSIVVSDTTPDEGDTISYTITVDSNAGNGEDAGSVTVNLPIPAGMTYVPSSIAGLGADDTDPLNLVWNLGTVPDASSNVLTYQVTADAVTATTLVSTTATTSGINTSNLPVNTTLNVNVQNVLTPQALVASSDDNIRDTDNSILGTTTIGNSGNRAIGLNNDQTEFLVVSSSGNAWELRGYPAFNLIDNAVTSGAIATRSVAWDNARTRWVALGDATMRVIDTATNTVTSLPTPGVFNGQAAVGVAIIGDNIYRVAANGEIGVTDITSATPTWTLENNTGISGVRGAGISPDQTKIWLITTTEVHEYDPNTNITTLLGSSSVNTTHDFAPLTLA